MVEIQDGRNLGSMEPQQVNVILEDGTTEVVTRFPLRTEFKVDPVTGDTLTRRHHGEDFHPITE